MCMISYVGYLNMMNDYLSINTKRLILNNYSSKVSNMGNFYTNWSYILYKDLNAKFEQ